MSARETKKPINGRRKLSERKAFIFFTFEAGNETKVGRHKKARKRAHKTNANKALQSYTLRSRQQSKVRIMPGTAILSRAQNGGD